MSLLGTTLDVTGDTLHPLVVTCYGFSFWETAGAVAVIEMRAGSVTGQVVRRLHFKANQSIALSTMKDVPLFFPGGCYVKVVSGAVSGSLDY